MNSSDIVAATELTSALLVIAALLPVALFRFVPASMVFRTRAKFMSGPRFRQSLICQPLAGNRRGTTMHGRTPLWPKASHLLAVSHPARFYVWRWHSPWVIVPPPPQGYRLIPFPLSCVPVWLVTEITGIAFLRHSLPGEVKSVRNAAYARPRWCRTCADRCSAPALLWR